MYYYFTKVSAYFPFQTRKNVDEEFNLHLLWECWDWLEMSKHSFKSSGGNLLSLIMFFIYFPAVFHISTFSFLHSYTFLPIFICRNHKMLLLNHISFSHTVEIDWFQNRYVSEGSHMECVHWWAESVTGQESCFLHTTALRQSRECLWCSTTIFSKSL